MKMQVCLWVRFGSTFVGGLKAGALIGVLISLSVGLSMASMYKMSSVELTLMDAVGNAVCSGLAGGLIGLYLGKTK